MQVLCSQIKKQIMMSLPLFVQPVALTDILELLLVSLGASLSVPPPICLSVIARKQAVLIRANNRSSFTPTILTILIIEGPTPEMLILENCNLHFMYFKDEIYILGIVAPGSPDT